MSKRTKIAGLAALSVLAVAFGVYSLFFGSAPDITGGDPEAGFALKWLNKAAAGKTDYCQRRAAGALATPEGIAVAIRDSQSLGKLLERRVKTKGPHQSPDGPETVVLFAARYAKAPDIEESVGVVKGKDGEMKVRSLVFSPPQLPTQLKQAKPLTDTTDLGKVKRAAEDWLYYFDQGDQRALAPLAFGNRKTINVGKARHLAQIRESRGKATSRKMSEAVLQLGIPGNTSLELARTVYNGQFGQAKAAEFVWLKRDSSADSPRWEVYDYWTRDPKRKPR